MENIKFYPKGSLFHAQTFLQHGLAVEPVLVKDQGEMTKLVFRDREVFVRCTTQSFIKQLCQLVFLDMKSLQAYVQDKLQKKQLLPIPLSYQLVLFPLRTAQLEEVKTRGFLWVVHRHLKAVLYLQESLNHCELILSNEYKVTVPYSKLFVQQQLRDSFLVEHWFHEVHYTSLREHFPSLIGHAPEDQQVHLQHLLHIAEKMRRYSP